MRWLLRWTAIGVAGAVVVASGVPAGAETPPSGPVPPASGVPQNGTAARITLITGDTVQLARAAEGRFTASVQPAKGRERITFHTQEIDGGLHVLPEDAVPYLSAGILDRGLFDVTALARDGYDDRSTKRLPLIVQYAEGASARPQAPAGATTAATLGSIGGAALSADKGGLDRFWGSLTAAPRSAGAATTFGSGIAKVWLDGKVRASLDRSVAQIGAPEAWKAGHDGRGVDVAVLDTGVDAAHPDLAGKVTAERNFTDATGAGDRHGHGTHVAATIGGTGAGSGGGRKGVAPGANVLNGKVLNDGGIGLQSWIIEGMEWAARSGAEVVNMSLGGPATDGTDPMSQAVNRLTEETGALFVIAAGNSGGDYTVGSPGAADAALTVGAVDRNDELASFSSRGPRIGDNAPKPEITAPGVGIVAARAEGTSMGEPVDARYTAASGTSMATPHVAGAAAILAQAHPRLRAARLKDALVSTARPNAKLNVHQQGGGRVDVARAVSQGVHATGVIDLGFHEVGKAGQAVTKQISYTNATGSAVTLDLDVQAVNLDNGTPEDDGITIGSERVTVPAGGTVQVPVTLDVTKLTRGMYGGKVTATGPGGVAVATSLAATVSAPIHTVTVSARDPQGALTPVPFVLFIGESRNSDAMMHLPPWDLTRTIELEEGTYNLSSIVEHGVYNDDQSTFYIDPELKVDRDMELVVDARRATPMRVETPKPSEQRGIFSYYTHRQMANGRRAAHGVMHFDTVRRLHVTPTRPLEAGSFEFSSRWQLVKPVVDARIHGVEGPLDMDLLHFSPTFDGRRGFRLAWAGSGTPEELAKANVRGAMALMAGAEQTPEQDQIAAAAKAGAATALIVRPPKYHPGAKWFPWGDREPIPSLVAGHDYGQRIIAAARSGKARIDLALTVSSPYLYDVFHVQKDRVPPNMVHKVTKANTAQITTRYGDNGGFPWAKEQRFGWRPWQEYSWNDHQRFVPTPNLREEWVSANDSLWQHRVHHLYTWDEIAPLGGGMQESPRTYTPRARQKVDWFAPVVRPAIPKGRPEAGATLRKDVMSLRIPEYVDATQGHYGVSGDDDDTVQARLWRDGTLVKELPDAKGDVQVGSDPAAYRLSLTTERKSQEWAWGTRTETIWDFRSGRSQGDEQQRLPLLQVDYRVPGDQYGRVPGRSPHHLDLTLRHQDGLAAPKGTAMTLQVSFDEGATWRAARLDRREGGAYRATIPSGKGTVSLRVQARDASGNAVTQSVIRAYGLS
ncbi:S8 family serine peptidase [Actinomadura viridis]|uniref:S8 family serine peptidase n=1 Tax=Actinomadura viridis TaxID=58110 RepID=UPI00367996F4